MSQEQCEYLQIAVTFLMKIGRAEVGQGDCNFTLYVSVGWVGNLENLYITATG